MDPISSFFSPLNLLITPGGVSAPLGTAMADVKGFTSHQELWLVTLFCLIRHSPTLRTHLLLVGFFFPFAVSLHLTVLPSVMVPLITPVCLPQQELSLDPGFKF